MFITHEVTYFTQKCSPVKGQWKVKGGIVFYSNDTVKRNISLKESLKMQHLCLKWKFLNFLSSGRCIAVRYFPFKISVHTVVIYALKLLKSSHFVIRNA